MLIDYYIRMQKRWTKAKSILHFVWNIKSLVEQNRSIRRTNGYLCIAWVHDGTLCGICHFEVFSASQSSLLHGALNVTRSEDEDEDDSKDKQNKLLPLMIF